MYLRFISITDQKSRDQGKSYARALIGSFMPYRSFLQCYHKQNMVQQTLSCNQALVETMMKATHT